MTEVVIGTTGDAGSDDATALGIALARTLHAAPVVAHVRPESWQVVGAGRVDAEWDRYLDESSLAVLAATVERRAPQLEPLGVQTDPAGIVPAAAGSRSSPYAVAREWLVSGPRLAACAGASSRARRPNT